MTNGETRFCGAILGGGRSSRMGQPKGLIDWKGLSLGTRGAGVLWRAGLRPLFYVGEPFPADLPGQVHRLPDDRPGLGPIGGMASLLSRAMSPVVVIAVDLIRVDEAVVRELCLNWRKDDLAIALSHKETKQPLCGIYSPGALVEVRQRAQNGPKDMLGLFEALHGRWIEWPDPKTLTNINKPEELQAALKQSDH